MAWRGSSPGCQSVAAAGYSRAVAGGDWVLVPDTTGSDYQTGAIAPLLRHDFEDAARRRA